VPRLNDGKAATKHLNIWINFATHSDNLHADILALASQQRPMKNNAHFAIAIRPNDQQLSPARFLL
jgi:hypothetical protein